MEQIQWIGDVAAICMCAVTVLFVMHQRARYRRGLSMWGNEPVIRNFNQELRQFAGEERTPLATLRSLGGVECANEENVKRNNDPGAHPICNPLQGSGQSQEGSCDPSDSAPGGRYGEVKRLADMGLDREEIFEKVGLPRGEIELVLKLNRLSSGPREKVSSGHSFLA